MVGTALEHEVVLRVVTKRGARLGKGEQRPALRRHEGRNPISRVTVLTADEDVDRWNRLARKSSSR